MLSCFLKQFALVGKGLIQFNGLASIFVSISNMTSLLQMMMMSLYTLANV